MSTCKAIRKGVLSTALLSISATSLASANLSPALHLHKDQEAEIAICGHHEHDDLHEREQAAVENFCRDDHAQDPENWVRFKILGFNDFHGQLESRTLSGRPVGGADVLASYLQAATAASPNGALIVHAGDEVGASPPVSALLQDEPSITFLNMLANRHCGYTRIRHEDHDADEDDGDGEHVHEHRDPRMDPRCNIVGTVGNHEFDEGAAEMLRLVNGGVHANGPFLDPNYRGAKFPYVVANVVDSVTQKPILPPYVIKKIKGIPVAVIGAILKETPTIVTPSGVAGLTFLDEATAINSYIPELKRKGIRAIVVTIHQGTRQNFFSGVPNPNPVDLGASIGPIVNKLDDEVDVIVAGHWHQFTNAMMPNANGKLILVTQAYARSTAYSDIDVALDPKSHDIVEKSARVLTTWADEGPGLTPHPQVSALVSQAVTAVKPLVERVIGDAAADILRAENASGESALGNLIADAQKAAMGTDIALMNAGGIRNDIHAGTVTWGELFAVQPFGNDLVRMDLTGEQIVRVLNQQWQGQPFARVMKPSGIRYTWQENDPATFLDNQVIPSSILVNGAPLDPAATYSVTTNNFMADGGDNYTVFKEAGNRVVGPVDLDALVNYVKTLPQPFSATIEGRINTTP